MTLLHLIIHWWKELYQQIFEFSLLFATKETCYWRIKIGPIFHEICKNYFGAIFKVLLNYWSAWHISKKFKKVWINSFTINVINEYLSTYKQDSEWFEQYRDYFSPYCTICWSCFPLSTHPLYKDLSFLVWLCHEFWTNCCRRFFSAFSLKCEDICDHTCWQPYIGQGVSYSRLLKFYTFYIEFYNCIHYAKYI